MTDNITRCPKCDTSFRISDTHLNTAKGSVRCGSCLTVFNARDHIIPSKEDTPASEAENNLDSATLEPPHSESAPLETKEDDILISDTMEMNSTKIASIDEFSSEFGDGFNNALSSTGEQEVNLFERENNIEDDDDETPQDESWALDLLNDDEPEPEESLEEEDEIEQDEFVEEQQNIFDTGEYDSAEHPPKETFYQNSFHIIEEKSGSSEDEEKPSSDLYHEYDDVEIEEYDYSDSASQVYAQPESTHDGGSDYLAAIEPEPVEFDYHGHKHFWQTRWFWGSLSLVAGVVLLGQIAWIKFPSWSRIEPYRGYYAHACSVLSCQLPLLIDRSKIRSANLVVRSHPKTRDALVVDAIIQNTAKFEQTFPVLDLVFADNLDQVVSARRLTPDDYLGGELAGRKYMPILQPVHIAIEIADPGQEATGYQIIIVN